MIGSLMGTQIIDMCHDSAMARCWFDQLIPEFQDMCFNDCPLEPDCICEDIPVCEKPEVFFEKEFEKEYEKISGYFLMID